MAPVRATLTFKGPSHPTRLRKPPRSALERLSPVGSTSAGSRTRVVKRRVKNTNRAVDDLSDSEPEQVVSQLNERDPTQDTALEERRWNSTIADRTSSKENRSTGRPDLAGTRIQVEPYLFEVAEATVDKTWRQVPPPCRAELLESHETARKRVLERASTLDPRKRRKLEASISAFSTRLLQSLDTLRGPPFPSTLLKRPASKTRDEHDGGELGWVTSEHVQAKIKPRSNPRIHSSTRTAKDTAKRPSTKRTSKADPVAKRLARPSEIISHRLWDRTNAQATPGDDDEDEFDLAPRGGADVKRVRDGTGAAAQVTTKRKHVS
ncbi:hypothetical protein JCM10212_001891 [Sporobolomyces blumeae]